MTHEEKNNLVSFVSNVLVNGYIILKLMQMNRAGASPGTDSEWSAARHLAAAREDVVVVGPEEPESWSEHEGAFASHYDEGRQFELASSEKVLVRLARDSVRGFQQVEKATGISFFRRHANLRIGPEGFSDDHYYNWDGIDAVGRVRGGLWSE